MENQILFYKVIGWIAALIGGIVTGILQAKLVKGLVFRSYAVPTIITAVSGSFFVGVVTGVLLIFFPYYEGYFMDWGTIYLKFVLAISTFYVVNLCTLWLATRKK